MKKQLTKQLNKLLLLITVVFGCSFTKITSRIALTSLLIESISEVKSQTYLTKEEADTLYKHKDYVPILSTFGYSIGFDGSGVYYDAPRPDYRFNIDYTPLLANVATSGNYNDLAFLPQIPNPGYGINTYGNQWNVDTLFFPKLSIFNLAISTLTASGATKADKTTSITINYGNYTSTKDLTSNITFTLPASKSFTTYSGTTDASGNFTMSFSTPYSVAPVVLPITPNQTDKNQNIIITSVSTTGFTANVYTRSSVTSLPIIGTLTTALLGAGTTNVNGASVDILVIEK